MPPPRLSHCPPPRTQLSPGSRIPALFTPSPSLDHMVVPQVPSPAWAPGPGKAPAPSPFPYPGETEPEGRMGGRGWGFKGQVEGEVGRGAVMEQVSPGFWGFTPLPKAGERDAVDEGTPGIQPLPGAP